MSHSSITLHKKEKPSLLNKVLTGNAFAWIVLVLVIILIVVRQPQYFLQPRFWAEEGTLHFAFSYSHNWLTALFQPQVGYLNFWANLATLLATLVPLETAPLVTTLMAMIVQLVPVVLILWSTSSIWNHWSRKLLGVAVLLFVPLTTEVWLNSVNSYPFFAVITFFILLVEPPSGLSQRWFYRILLVFSGLTGTNSCFLIPLFALRAWQERNRERWLQLILLSICAVIQIILIFSFQSGGNIGQRFHIIGLSTFGLTMWTQGFGLFAFGYDQASNWATLFYSMALEDMTGFQTWSRAMLAVGFTLLFVLTANLPLKTRIYFVGAYFILMLLPMMFSVVQDKYWLAMTGLHQRIFLAPNILLGWMLLLGIQFRQGNHRYLSLSNLISFVCILLLTASLLWGIKTFREQTRAVETWPDWKQEVEIWRTNPNYALRIQPDGWFVELQK